MITFIFALITAVIVGSDYLAYRRYISTWSRKWLRIAAVTMFALANATPYILLALAEWVIADNSTTTMYATMWISTVYFITTLSRIAFYAGALTIRSRRVALTTGALLCSATLAIMLYGATVTRTDISVTETELGYNNLPASFDGYRIAFFSDLHIGSMLDAERECSRVVERINALDADLAVFGGDLINVRYSELTPEISDILRGIRTRDGVVAVLGNHDTGVYIRDSIALPRETNLRLLAERIGDLDWNLLRDSTVYLNRGTDSIAVTGIDYTEKLLEYKHSLSTPEGYDASASFVGVADGVFDIAVSHLPQLWSNIAATGCGDLTLSGHVHATQAKLELGDMRLSPAMLMYRQWSGLYDDGTGRRLYINDGIGYVGYYLRIGAKPEITLITLQR